MVFPDAWLRTSFVFIPLTRQEVVYAERECSGIVWCALGLLSRAPRGPGRCGPGGVEVGDLETGSVVGRRSRSWKWMRSCLQSKWAPEGGYPPTTIIDFSPSRSTGLAEGDE